MEASYLSLSPAVARGKLEHLWSLLENCELCPRRCGVRRLEGETGFCGTGRLAVVARSCVHRGEEPPLSGDAGSGTVFFSGCNLACVYCQNHQISQPESALEGHLMDDDDLAAVFLDLQDRGCHNINLVSPTHVAPQIAFAILRAAEKGLRLPVVYNSNGYDSPNSLKLLEGFIDIYLPDFKYGTDVAGEELSGATGYVSTAREAITEMFRQAGPLQLDKQGVATRGLLIRHLVLPGDSARSGTVMEIIHQAIGAEVPLSLMSQYFPAHRAPGHPQVGRFITADEYAAVLDQADALGLNAAWIQEMESRDSYRPDFTRDHPFEWTLDEHMG